MPQLQVVDLNPRPAPKREPTALDNIVGSFLDARDERQDLNALTDIYRQNEEDGNSIEKLYKNIQTDPRLSPTTRTNAMKQALEFGKFQQEKKKQIEADLKSENQRLKESEKKRNEAQIIKDREKELGLDEGALSHYEGNISKLPKPIKPKNESLTPFERTRQTEEAKKLIKLEEEIPKAKDAIANLDRIDQLADNELSGVKGFVKAAFNTESAKEMENLSFTSIEPIIKLFNPVGPIPVAKVNIIRQQFQAHPGDLRTTIKGKNAALRRIAEQGIARAEERVRLIKQNNGQVPEEQLKKFDQESAQLMDVISDQESFNVKLKEAGENGSISGLYSKDGRPLNPIPAKEAKQLYEQGLITNVPS